MVKRALIEIGRIALVNYGTSAGKYVVVVDVVDSATVLVDGPTSGVVRQALPIKHIALTNIKIKIPRSVNSFTLKKFITLNGVDAKVAAVASVKKAAKQAIRASLTDFQRFQVTQLKKQKAAIVRKLAL